MADMWNVDSNFGARPFVDRLTFMFTDGQPTTGITLNGDDFGPEEDVIIGSRRVYCRAHQYSHCKSPLKFYIPIIFFCGKCVRKETPEK